MNTQISIQLSTKVSQNVTRTLGLKPSYRGAVMFFLLVFLSLHPPLFSPLVFFLLFFCAPFLFPPSSTLTHSLTRSHFYSLFSVSCKHLFCFTPFSTLCPFMSFQKWQICTHTLTQRKNNRYVCRHACKHRQHTHTLGHSMVCCGVVMGASCSPRHEYMERVSVAVLGGGG